VTANDKESRGALPPCRVSIITAVYNGAPFLHEAIASVFSQTLADWEWIIVDDGSTDATPEILGAIADPRVRVVRQDNRGVAAARNAALDLVRGDFVAFLDADDRLPTESLAKRVALFESQPEASLVEGCVRFFDGASGREVKTWTPRADGLIFRRLLRLDSRVLCGPYFMVRRAATAGIRFKEGLTHCEDLLFIVSLSRAHPVVYRSLPDVVYEYRRGSHGAMSDMEGLDAGYRTLVAELRRIVGRASIDLLCAKLRIATVLFLSWRAHGPLRRGAQSALDVLFRV